MSTRPATERRALVVGFGRVASHWAPFFGETHYTLAMVFAAVMSAEQRRWVEIAEMF